MIDSVPSSPLTLAPLSAPAALADPANGKNDTFQEALKRTAARKQQQPRQTQAPKKEAPAPVFFHNATDLAVVDLVKPAQVKLSVANATAQQSTPGTKPPVDQSKPPAEPDPLAPESTSRPQPPRSSGSGSTQNVAQKTLPAAQPTRTEAPKPTVSSSTDTPEPSSAKQDGAAQSDSHPQQQNSAAAQTAPAEPEAALASGATQAAAAQPIEPQSTAPSTTTASDARALDAIGAAKPAPPGNARPVAAAPNEKQPAQQSEQQDKIQAQFGRGLAAALRQNGGTVTLRLHPEDLGDMKIRLQIQKGRVDAQFEVATKEAHQALGDSLDHLRAALESRGLTVNSLDVQTVGHHDPKAPAGRDAESGPGFANHDHGTAGGDPGDHGRAGAERDRKDLVGQAVGLPGDRSGRPSDHQTTAEPDQEHSPLAAWMRAGGGTPGGAPTTNPGLDAVA